MGFMFGDGGKEEARRQAELSRQQQEVANNRQLAELNRAGERNPMVRRRPRGRRLFADAGDTALPANLA
jgi:hypothetical protein